MDCAKNLPLVSGYKLYLTILFLVLINIHARGQSCDCPSIYECSPCEGGLISLTLRYQASDLLKLPAVVTVTDGNGNVLFTGTVADGEEFSFSSFTAGQPFAGDQVSVSADVVSTVVIGTSCGTPVYEGDIYGNYKVREAITLTGEPICCPVENLETNPPVISGCPADITINLSETECSAVVSWTEPTATDDCNIYSFTSNYSPGAVFYPGTTQIVYTAVDDYGNTSTCSFNVILQDNSFPVITECPADILVDVSSNCEISVSWTEPILSDNCKVNASKTHSPGDMFPLGTTTVTYTATDDSGNTATCSFNVIVKDELVPVFLTCPSNQNLNNSPDISCGTIATWTEPTVSDSCTVTLTSTHKSGDFFPRGSTVVTYTATDAAGNVATCSFKIIANDVTKPVISGCPTSDIIVEFDGDAGEGPCEAVATWDPITATDNCEYVTVTSDYASGDKFPVGKTKVTYTATDSTGNSAKCSFNVIVQEKTPPVISNCPGDISTSADASCVAVVSWTPPTVTDNCSATFTSTHAPGATFPLGTTVVTYTASDASGNITTCSFNVTVNDITPPVFSNCPANIVATADASCQAAVSWTAPTASDNCSTTTITSSHSPGDIFAIGTTTVTYTAVDSIGNSSICSFTVTVNDETAPVISACPADITVTADGSCQASASWTAPTATDNCTASPAITSSHSPGDVFGLGTTTVTYTATDAAGNASTCSFTVTVNDETAPVISACPADITVTADGSCQASASWTAPTATDNCTASPVITSSHSPGDVFSLGTTTVTYTATDAAGNASTCSFTITVHDETAPVISACPADIVATTDGSCGASVNWTAPTATDNCTASPVITSSHSPGDVFGLGTTTVTYTATDAAGYSSTCSFTVTVNDETAPVLSTCPADITVTADGFCGASVSWTAPTATDNCTASPVITSSHNPGNVFGLGTTTVTYTATDAAGYSSTCSFTVTVNDKTAPVLSACPADIIVTADGSCGASVSWTAPTATDNCTASPVITSSDNPGDIFSSGTTTVTYTATDEAGNAVTCSFNITVNDETAPVFSGCPADIITTTDDSCGASVNWTAPTASDNCTTSPVITSSHNPGDMFATGTTTVNYTTTDAAGYSSTCSFTVTVNDETAPVFSGCPADIQLAANSSCEASVSWSPPTANDNCGNVTVSASHNSGDNFTFGTTEVTYTATDEKGNSSSCQFNVIVNPEPPVLTNCPEDINVKADASGQAAVDWIIPSADASCGNITLTASHEPGDLFSIGTTEVHYEATDESGQSITCNFNVTVTYEEINFDILRIMTPNGDGNNDEWVLSNIERFKNNKVIIVDRWGSEIFNASGYDNQMVVWRGLNKNGSPVPTGTYYYLISVSFASQVVEKRGFIELVR